MKKKMIILLSCIIVLIIILLTLMFVGIIPNVFLDTKKMVCNRIYDENDFYKQEDFIEIYFNNKAIIKNGRKISELVYYDDAIAQQNFNELKKIFSEQDDSRIKFENKKITISVPLEITLNQVEMNKIQIKQAYEKYGYDCQ